MSGNTGVTFGWNITYRSNAARLIANVSTAKDWPLPRAGAYIRGVAQRMIKMSKEMVTDDYGTHFKSAPPGHPPFTHTGALKRAIMFAVESERLYVGPSFSGIGKIGHTHEFGVQESDMQQPRRNRPRHKPKLTFKLGTTGPISDNRGDVHWCRLESRAQVRRSIRLAQKLWPSRFGAGSPQGANFSSAAAGNSGALARIQAIADRSVARTRVRNYPKRPTMRKALGIVVDSKALPPMWAGSIKGG